MKTVIIIPARFQSSRFPGKPLTKIAGKPMILRVWEKCIQALPNECVFIATDNEEIQSCCETAGANVIMTPSSCKTGTDRLYEASKLIDADIYINVQGDEPLIHPSDILTVIDASKKNPEKLINAYCNITSSEEYFSNTVPKVVFGYENKLLYMSRSPIPGNKTAEFVKAKKQVCIYAFPKALLSVFGQHDEKTELEEQEDIEILRFLELGYDVTMIEVSSSSIAVDTPEDAQKVEKAINDQSL